MKADEIAPLIAAGSGKEEVGFHQGFVLAWDAVANTNRVEVAGSEVVNLPVLSSGSVLINVGDSVGVLRIRHQYFILGRIAPIQQALSMRGDYVSTLGETTSTTYTDLTQVPGPSLTPGPTLSNVYIGPSRRCLVLLKASMSIPSLLAGASAYASMSLEVSGASSITATWMEPAAAYIGSSGPSPTISLSASSHTIIKANDGLNAGLNTFTAKYRSVNGQTVQFLDRDIFVLPM